MPWLRRGPLFRGGGVAVYDALVDGRTFAGLCAEARAHYACADRQVCDVVTSDHCDGRGGVPPRQLCTAGGGPVQDDWYRSPALHAFLRELCGGPIRPSGSRGSYSYYVEPADHLGLHLDIVTCDVTVISVLADSSPDNGGALAVQRGNVGVPLSVLRRSARVEEEVVKAPAGSSIVILGGLVPHRVLPLTTGQRVISALCFEAA
ncbi:hypothetical protein [Variovorax sp. JS1663]|uniref:hypothetical protein n=1 Tax=Variovorax sp. JS1663 TaxID=1851577 RepID=UPI00117C271B|nr:hypothetical protein [Variovorax sp. JS1663]